MLSGEDFGYLKDEEQHRMAIIAKKALLLGSVLFSISCFIYITVNAYYFAYHDKDSNIRVIKSPIEPIKVMAEGEGVSVKDVDKTIYDNIVGNHNLSRENLNNVRVLEQAAAPLVRKRNPDLVQENLNNNVNNQPLASRRNNSAIVIDNSQPKNNSDAKKNGDEMVYDVSKKNSNVNDASLKSTTNNNVNDASLKSTAGSVKKDLRGLSRVQVAALSSKNSAVEYWSRLNKNYPNLVSQLNYFISEVNLGKKGTFYRLQLGNFRNQVDAEEFCRKFISQSGKSKADCIIVE